MKKHLLVTFFLLSMVSLTNAQIPNAGFETWTAGNPNGWLTSNVPTFMTNVTQSNESHSGSSAAKLVVGFFITGPYPAIMYSDPNEDGTFGFPVTQRYGSLRGYYKLTSDPKKVLDVVIILQKNGNFIGGGAEVLGGNVPSYTEFVVPISYGTSDVPDTAIIEILYSDTAEVPTVGGGAFVDDLSLSGSVDVKEIKNNELPSSYLLIQNYPNPFNPSTKIEYTIPEESFVSLKIYNLIGQEVAILVNQNQNAGTYRADFNADGMQSGIYIAKLSTNGFTKIVKMTLLK